MKTDLEALVLAYEAWTELPRGAEADRLKDIYDSRIEAVVKKYGVPREILNRSVELQHGRWVKAQKKTTSLPPQA